MALYKTHSTFNIFVVLPLALTGIWFFLVPETKYMQVFAAAFIYATLFLGPDLDLAYHYKLKSLRGILTLPFRPYARIFKHRGISHHIVFGTVSRMLWLTLIFLGISFICSWDVMKIAYSLKKNLPYLFYGLGALFLADLSHLFLDFLYTKKI